MLVTKSEYNFTFKIRVKVTPSHTGGNDLSMEHNDTQPIPGVKACQRTEVLKLETRRTEDVEDLMTV